MAATQDTILEAFPDLNRVKRFFPLGVDNPTTLTIAQVERFNREGFLSPLDVFSDEEIQVHREFFDRCLAEAAARGWNSYSINGWHARLRTLWDLVCEPRILDYVQDLLGEDLICWGTHYFCKMPGDGKAVAWHQDASYWPITPSKTVTVWLAIDDATVENGAMQVIPTTHLQGQIAYSESDASENNVLNQTVHGVERFGVEPVPLVMRAGQMSLHTDWLLHGSEPNNSPHRRCGLTMRFVSPDVEAKKGWNRQGILCRGEDHYGHWPHVPRPESDHIPDRRSA